MFNPHLLQLGLTVEEFRETWKEIPILRLKELREGSDARYPAIQRFPSYAFAICPICHAENTERVNTYTANGYLLGHGGKVFTHGYPTGHCSHFACVHVFYNFHGIHPTDAEGDFAPEVPFVAGHLLEKGTCQAVLHALPVCQIENDAFVPRFTMFLMTYFAEDAKRAYGDLIGFVVEQLYIDHVSDFALPPSGCEHWWLLRYWVKRGLLHWVDASGPRLELRTGDVTAFPYEDIKGRMEPHYYPLKPRKPQKKRTSFWDFWKR